jgi:hypothetical protein
MWWWDTYGPRQLSQYLDAVGRCMAACDRATAAAKKRDQQARAREGKNPPGGGQEDIALRYWRDYGRAFFALANNLRGVPPGAIPEPFKAAHRLLIRGEEDLGQAYYAYSLSLPSHITRGRLLDSPVLSRRQGRATQKMNKVQDLPRDMVSAWFSLVKAEVRRLRVKPPAELLPKPAPSPWGP